MITELYMTANNILIALIVIIIQLLSLMDREAFGRLLLWAVAVIALAAALAKIGGQL